MTMAERYTSANDVLADVRKTPVYLGIDLRDVNDRGLFGSTPLSVAITWGNPEAVRLLIDAGADVNAITELGRTLLHDAVSFGNIEIVRLLLERGAQSDQRDAMGDRPVDIATTKNRNDLVGLLKSRE
jgi:ankyrin repeat protein